MSDFRNWLDVPRRQQGPQSGMLADVPLPPRRPFDLGQPPDGADLPGPRTMPSTPRHAYGRPSYAEGEAMPPGPGQFNIQQLNQVLGAPEQHSSEDVADIPQRPLPPEYQPARPIPLGEIQRKWGVPRMEDL
jgi:hypothetical protein